jgi:superfamily II DNA or RNA helicase
MIVADILSCVKEGRAPLVLADRKSYLDRIETVLAEQSANQPITRFRLESGVGKKARAEIRAKIEEHYEKRAPFVILATSALVGEGFDLPQLDTLVLAMPLSFKGRLIQYAGRLHREHEGKQSVRIYDYLDENSPLTRAMFRRRAVGYRQMGYQMDLGDHVDEDVAGLLDLPQ